MKKFIKLIPALAMLLIATMLVSTATFAWFSMNTQVTATNMKVKAVAESGIVISNTNKTTWSNTAEAQVNAAEIVPTSAATLTAPAWVHAMSTNADEAQPNQAVANYTDLSLVWETNGVEGIGYTDNDGSSTKNAGDTCYVLLNNFYIKSSGDAISGTLYINDLSVTSNAAGGAFNKLDNALRVLIVVNGTDAFTYAPVINQAGGTTTTSYKWKNTTVVDALYNTTALDKQCTSVTSIPNTNADAINVKVYMYFEGEDANLKSTNISGLTMNDLSLTIHFGTTQTNTITGAIGAAETVGEGTYYPITGTEYYVDSSAAAAGATLYTVSGDTATALTNKVYGGTGA
ncbi:MAG: hypothetical protein IJS45_10560 [Clostridia bacterium]|nr:hypothetical protein [Clostridia bacterium]